MQAQQIVSEIERASALGHMVDDHEMIDDQSLPLKPLGGFDALPNAGKTLPKFNLDEHMMIYEPSDFEDIAGYSNSDSDSASDSDSDPEDLYRDDSSDYSSVTHSSNSSLSSSIIDKLRTTSAPHASSTPSPTVSCFVPTVEEPYWKGAATNAEEECAVVENIFRMVSTHLARKRVAAGYPLINTDGYRCQTCSWTLRPIPGPWGPKHEALLLREAARRSTPFIVLTDPDGVCFGLKDAIGDLRRGWLTRHTKRDKAQPVMRKRLAKLRVQSESDFDRHVRMEKDKFWEQCMAKDAEMARVEMEEIKKSWGIQDTDEIDTDDADEMDVDEVEPRAVVSRGLWWDRK